MDIVQKGLENKVETRPRRHLNNKACKNFLKSVPLFSEFDDNAIDKVLEKAAIKEYKRDKLLFLTGDKAEYFYVIVSGWVKLFRETRDGHETVISVLTHGDVFGKTAILQNGFFTYTTEVIVIATIIQIPASFMLQMAEDHEHFDHFLARFLEAELGEVNQRCLEAEHLAQMTSAERVGCFLLKMCGGNRKSSVTLQLPYEKSLVAGRLGMMAETFSRSLNQLAAMGVEKKNSVVTLHNIDQLRAQICEHCSATRKECPLGDETDTT